jgi:hypothetical protein
VKLAQLLDKPWVDTPKRTHADGLRCELSLQLMLTDRQGSIGPCWYAFHLRSIAIGTTADALSLAMQAAPRCVGGQGAVYGGSALGWEFRAGEAAAAAEQRGSAAVDALNDRLVGEHTLCSLCTHQSAEATRESEGKAGGEQSARAAGGRRRGKAGKGKGKAVAADDGTAPSPRDAVMKLLRAPLFARFSVAEADGERRLAAVRTQWADIHAETA